MAGAGSADSIHSNPRVAIGTIFKTYRTGECRSHFTVDLTSVVRAPIAPQLIKSAIN